MFVPIFTLNLNQKLLPGRISIGEFDGEHPCLVAATTGERVLIHSPHQKQRGLYFVHVPILIYKIIKHIMSLREWWRVTVWFEIGLRTRKSLLQLAINQRRIRKYETS